MVAFVVLGELAFQRPLILLLGRFARTRTAIRSLTDEVRERARDSLVILPSTLRHITRVRTQILLLLRRAIEQIRLELRSALV